MHDIMSYTSKIDIIITSSENSFSALVGRSVAQGSLVTGLTLRGNLYTIIHVIEESTHEFINLNKSLKS